MNEMNLFLGIIPLIAFVIIDSFLGLKKGLIAAIFFALLELVYTLITFHTVDYITGLSVSLVLIMSFFAWKKKSEKWFLLQPVILSIFLAIFFIVTYLINEPVLVSFIYKYGKQLLPPEKYQLLTQPIMIEMLKASTLTCGVAFFLHALTTWFAAIKLNKWWWVAARGIGFYVFMIMGFIGARLLVA